MTNRFLFTYIVVGLLAVSAPVAAAQIIEDFNSSATATNGGTLGKCGQLKVGLAGSGSITVNGSGTAIINTASIPDSAVIYSTSALPATYLVTVKVKNVNYHKTSVENGVTVLAIANGTPTPGTEADWLSKRLVGVEIDSKPYFTSDSSIFVNYWDAGWNMHTWDGSKWNAGDPGWAPYFPVHSSYEVTIEKTTSHYTITVRSGGSQITQSSVPIGNVMSPSSEYLVVGDRLTDHFSGNIEVDSITMPGPTSCSQSDSGPPPKLDGGSYPDAKEFKPPEAGGAWPDGYFSSDTGNRSTPRPGQPSSCDCNLTAESGGGPLALAPLLLLLLLVRRRR